MFNKLPIIILSIIFRIKNAWQQAIIFDNEI